MTSELEAQIELKDKIKKYRRAAAISISALIEIRTNSKEIKIKDIANTAIKLFDEALPDD